MKLDHFLCHQNNYLFLYHFIIYTSLAIVGPPVPVEDVLQVSSEEGQTYEAGEPATIYIPFHSNPAPEW